MRQPWTQTTEQLCREFDVEPTRGLTTAQAQDRLERDGKNQLRQASRAPAWRRLLGQFKDVTVIALLVAALLATAMATFSDDGGSLLSRYGDSLAIVLIVLLNAVMGFVQEGKAHRALQALQGFLSPQTVVWRDGRRAHVPATEIVVGDILSLEEGTRIPADARLLTSEDLLADESALTGESTPVEKTADSRLDADTALAERSNMLFMGTYVQRGSGTAVVAVKVNESTIVICVEGPTFHEAASWGLAVERNS